MRILLVDDNLDILEAVVELLEEMGCEVAGTSSFTEADALLESASWDFLLSDFLIEDNSGINLYFKAIKLGIFVVIMSGSEEACLLCEEKNIPFLAKPFTISKLIAITELSSAYTHAA